MIFKKQGVLFLTVFGFLLSLSQIVHAYCLVATERDPDSGNINDIQRSITTLRNKVYASYNVWSTLDSRRSGSEAICTTNNGSDPFDAGLGFNQAIIFATAESGNWGVPDVNTIILNGHLTFNNDAQNLVIGNWPAANQTNALPDSTKNYSYQYPGTYTLPAPRFSTSQTGYGLVTLDARNVNDQPLRCAPGTQQVVLRNIAILTRNLSKTDLFNINSSITGCLRDGGAVYVCGVNPTAGKNPGQDGWCPGAPTTSCDEDGDGFRTDSQTCPNNPNIRPGDCNDLSNSNGGLQFPGNQEICDTVDNDCNGTANDIASNCASCGGHYYFRDADGDGYGRLDPAAAIFSCAGSPPTGYATEERSRRNLADCDDDPMPLATDPTRTKGSLKNPGLSENCTDGIDNNCDNAQDYLDANCEDLHLDRDGDGYCRGVDTNGDNTLECVESGKRPGDCNDDPNNANSRLQTPGKTDIPGNGIDEDCSGTDAPPPPGGDPKVDNDGDGFCEDQTACTDTAKQPKDCNDANPNEKPNGTEKSAAECSDTHDNDCDSKKDGQDPGCTPAGELTEDNDGDTFTENAGDCVDTDPEIHPNAVELCDGINNDCNEATKDQGCSGEKDIDDDGDGYCEDSIACAGNGIKPGDCDDTKKEVNPDAKELCTDDIDNDCNGKKGSTEPPATPPQPAPALTTDEEEDAEEIEEIEVLFQTTQTELCDIVEPPPSPDNSAEGGCGCHFNQPLGTSNALLNMLVFGLLPLGFVLWHRRKTFS